MVGDGYCNDETNTIHCNFDGGDCCYSCKNEDFCSQCKCLTENEEEEFNPLIGNGFCNDETNIPECHHDGLDCCVNVNSDFCFNCSCYCLNLELVGNGFCNDETYNAECGYDGGDCCGPDISCKFKDNMILFFYLFS